MATHVAPRPPPVGLTVDQYDFLIERGRLPENPATELIGGQIVYKDRSHAGGHPMSVGVLHAWVIDGLNELKEDVRRASGGTVLLRTQLPIVIPPSHEPEPDGSLVRGSRADDLAGHPQPDDVLCVIEAADSSLGYDRTVKLGVYAEGGVPVYIIVNIPDRVLERHTDPRPGDASYGSVATIGPGGVLRLPIGAGQTLDVPADRLIPPP
jgi:hypothetical protein